MEHVKQAVNDWKSKKAKDKFCFILQLGDLIEAFRFSKNTDAKKTAADKANNSIKKKEAYKIINNELDTNLRNILNVLNSIKLPIYHIWGNHEIGAFRHRINQLYESELNSSRKYRDPKSISNYYSIEVSSKVQLICLDLYEENALFKNNDKKKKR